MMRRPMGSVSPVCTAARWLAVMNVFGTVSVSTTFTIELGFSEEK